MRILKLLTNKLGFSKNLFDIIVSILFDIIVSILSYKIVYSFPSKEFSIVL